MLKIGLIGGAKKWHGMTFSEIINGYDHEQAAKKQWPPQYNTVLDGSARITDIWDPVRTEAEEVAEICGIPNVRNNFLDVIGKVDGVIITDDCSMTHQKKALPFIKAGLRIFIDKPISSSPGEATEFFRLAERYGAKLFSSSALRFADEVTALRNGRRQCGILATGSAICRKYGESFTFYGIHAMEMLCSIVGMPIAAVANTGTIEGDIVTVEFTGGARFTVSAFQEISDTFQVNLFGSGEARTVTADNSEGFYFNLLNEIVKFFLTGKSPVDAGETINIIATLAAAEKSAANGGKFVKIQGAECDERSTHNSYFREKSNPRTVLCGISGE